MSQLNILMNSGLSLNIKRVIIAGSIAGITILILGVGLVPVVGDQMDQALLKLGIPPMSSAAMVFFAVMSIILGIAMIWIYALVHKYFQSKFKAVLSIAILFWFFTYFWSNAALVAYGFLPFNLVAIGTLWGLLELVISCWVGAKLYSPKK